MMAAGAKGTPMRALVGTPMRTLVGALAGGRDIPDDVLRDAFVDLLSAETTDVDIAACLMGFAVRGIDGRSLALLAEVLRSHAPTWTGKAPAVLLDTCGTGGDGAGSFNVSTMAALVVASMGVPVVKHGNRAVSSKSGSADLLEALGLSIDGPLEAAVCEFDARGFAFLFAPSLHAATKKVGAVRKQLRVPTMFNLVGPLSNPAPLTHQLVGVYGAEVMRPMAEALHALGRKGAWVVHGRCGLDEIAPEGETDVMQCIDGEVLQGLLHPSRFGLEEAALDSVRGGDAAENAARARALLSGATDGPYLAVVLNASAALALAEGASLAWPGQRLDAALQAAARRVEDALVSGRAAAFVASLGAAKP